MIGRNVPLRSATCEPTARAASVTAAMIAPRRTFAASSESSAANVARIDTIHAGAGWMILPASDARTDCATSMTPGVSSAARPDADKGTGTRTISSNLSVLPTSTILPPNVFCSHFASPRRLASTTSTKETWLNGGPTETRYPAIAEAPAMRMICPARVSTASPFSPRCSSIRRTTPSGSTGQRASPGLVPAAATKAG